MRRYEVWCLASGDKTGNKRLVMILQSHKIDHLTTIIVAPLRSDSADVAIPALTPQIDIQGTKYTILVPFMAAIDKKQMLAFVYNGEPVGYEIDRAIDRLFLGV